jgi:transposase-like protein
MTSKWVAAEKKEKLRAGLAAGKSISELSRETGLSRNYIYGFRRREDPKHKVSVGVTNTVFQDSLSEIANLKTAIQIKNEVILDLLDQIVVLKNANMKE